MKNFLTILIFIFTLTGCGEILNKPYDSARELGGSFNEDALYGGGGQNVPLNSPENSHFMRRTVRVGLLLPLSGKAARLGQSMQDAATLALWDQYAALSDSYKRNVQIIILPKDTKGTMDGAEAAAKEVLAEGANIILGPLYSSSVTAVAPIAKEHGVHMVSFSNNKSVAGDGVFVMGFQPDEQIKRVVEFSAMQGSMNFASLTPNDAYGEMVKNSLKYSLAELGQYEMETPSVYKQSSYRADTSRYARPIRSLLDFEEKKYRAKLLKEQEEELELEDDALENEENEEIETFDTLLIPEGGKPLLDIVKLLKYYNFDKENTQLIGSGQWDNPQVLKAELLHGAWFATSSPDKKNNFFRHFEKQFGYKPQRLASLAYDAMALAAVLSFANDFSEKSITNPAGFNGPADGLFRFQRNGVVERKLAVLEVGADGFTVIDEAPESFEIEGFNLP